MSVRVNTAELDRFMRDLNGAQQRVLLTSIKWVKRLTDYTNRRMKRYASSRTQRSTGKLANSITSQVSIKGRGVYGVVYPAGNVPYKFAAEHGRRGGKIIRARGAVMSFPTSAWKKGSRNTNVARMAHNGKFYFSKIRTGKYTGKQYVERSYQDLQSYYQSKESVIVRQIGDVILFDRRTG